MSSQKLHQPDINGTHTPLDTPLSEEIQQLFREWTKQGNLFAPNTSYTVKKIARNIHNLANCPYITELGVAAYEADADTPVLYHALSAEERQHIAAAFENRGLELVRTAAFFPKHEKGDNHGMQVYINPKVAETDHQRLLARHFAVEQLTFDTKVFADWTKKYQKDFGMVEWKPFDDRLPEALKALNLSNDSGGTYFVTPKGINKATTFTELLKLRYRDIPLENISIAGDSPPTDGPLFTIPGITHIAVGDRSMLKNVGGKNLYVKTPDEANKVLKKILQQAG